MKVPAEWSTSLYGATPSTLKESVSRQCGAAGPLSLYVQTVGIRAPERINTSHDTSGSRYRLQQECDIQKWEKVGAAAMCNHSSCPHLQVVAGVTLDGAVHVRDHDVGVRSVRLAQLLPYRRQPLAVATPGRVPGEEPVRLIRLIMYSGARSRRVQRDKVQATVQDLGENRCGSCG